MIEGDRIVMVGALENGEGFRHPDGHTLCVALDEFWPEGTGSLSKRLAMAVPSGVILRIPASTEVVAVRLKVVMA